MQATGRRSLQSKFGAPLFLRAASCSPRCYSRLPSDSPRFYLGMPLHTLTWECFTGSKVYGSQRRSHLLGDHTLRKYSCYRSEPRVCKSHCVAAGFAFCALSMIAAKCLFQRPRPASRTLFVLVGNPAFPSGHVAVGSVVYVFLAYLIIRELRGRLSRTLLLRFSVILTLSLAWTRLYLGVHWTSLCIRRLCACDLLARNSDLPHH